MRWTSEDARKLGLFSAIIMLMGGMNQAESQASRTFVVQDENNQVLTLSGHFSPYWSHGAILAAKDNPSDEPVILRIGKNGEREQIRFSIPHGRHTMIHQLAAAQGGTLAVIGSAYSDDGRGTTFLANVQADRKQQTVIQPWPYVPSVVTFTPDGKIWVIGRVRDGDWVSEWNVLKRFDESGRLLSTIKLEGRPYIRSGDDLDKPRIRDAAELSALRSSKDRIGWLTRGDEYIEFSPDGRELIRYDGPERGCSDKSSAYLALSPDNEVIVGPTMCKNQGYWRLDRKTRRWEPVIMGHGKVADGDIVFGFDGDTLVTSTVDGKIRRYVAEWTK